MFRVKHGNHINYCYTIYDSQTRSGVLIDPSWEFDTITKKISELSINVKGILITHEHADHVNLAEIMSFYYDVPIYISPESALQTNLNQERLRLIENEAPLIFDGISVQPLKTPGHTLGCICYIVNGNLFSGDTVFMEGCGMCWGDNSSTVKLFHSLRRLVTILPPSTAIYPGHKYYLDLGQSMDFVLQHNIYLNITDEEDFVNYRTRSGQKNLLSFA